MFSSVITMHPSASGNSFASISFRSPADARRSVKHAAGSSTTVAQRSAQQLLQIGIATGDDQADAPAGEAFAMAQHGRERGRGGRLGQDLESRPDQAHRRQRFRIADQQYLDAMRA